MTTFSRWKNRSRMALIALCVLASGRAVAKPMEEIEERAVTEEPQTVVRPLYTMDGRVDIGLLGAMSISDRLVSHIGGALAADYHLSEMLSLELYGHFGQSKLVGLVESIRDQTKATTGDDLAGGGQPSWTGQLGARFTPLYGKFNLASELSVSFHFYVMGGIGAAQVKYVPILTSDDETTSSVGPAGNVGLGLRLWLNRNISLRVEARQLFFADKYLRVTDGTFNSPSDPDPKATLGQMSLILAGLGVTL